MVFLRDEISFIEAYADLMQIRYNDNFKLNMTINQEVSQHYLIPPVSLMVAIENATKHNEISTRNPLTVNIFSDEDYITVSNGINFEKKSVRIKQSRVRKFK